MIDFACRRFSLEEVIRCSLSLTKGEFRILQYFMSDPIRDLTSKDIARALKVDLSTVQRAVKKLTEKQVILRKQINIDGGGFFFCYTLKDKAEVRAVISEIVQHWTERVKQELEKA